MSVGQAKRPAAQQSGRWYLRTVRQHRFSRPTVADAGPLVTYPQVAACVSAWCHAPIVRPYVRLVVAQNEIGEVLGVGFTVGDVSAFTGQSILVVEGLPVLFNQGYQGVVIQHSSVWSGWWP